MNGYRLPMVNLTMTLAMFFSNYTHLSLAIRAKLDEHKYQRLNPDASARDVNEFLIEHLDEVMLLLDAQTCANYKQYNQVCLRLIIKYNILIFISFMSQLGGEESDADAIIEYSKLVGKVCAHRMLYVNML